MVDTQELYEIIKEVFILLDAGDRYFLGQYDLTVPRYYALYHLGTEPGMSLSRLSERMLCDKSNATRIVKGLETRGFIYRRPHETDGRTLRLFLTPKGQKLRDEISETHITYNSNRLNAIHNIELDDLKNTLDSLKVQLGEQVANCSSNNGNETNK